MSDQPISGHVTSGRCFIVKCAKASLMSTSIIPLPNSCSDPRAQLLRGAELTPHVFAEERAPVLSTQAMREAKNPYKNPFG